MKPLAQINVIPFIDIMLVLLAIVLTTATFVAQGKIPVQLASATEAKPLSSLEPLVIAIDEAGTVYLDGEGVTPGVLAVQLASIASETPILLRVDSRASFKHFVGVIDILKAQGLENLSIAAKRSDA